jgi:hypothetical protein
MALDLRQGKSILIFRSLPRGVTVAPEILDLLV